MRLLSIAHTPIATWKTPPSAHDAVLDLAHEPIGSLQTLLHKTSRALRFGADLVVVPPTPKWASSRDGRAWLAQLVRQAKARGYTQHTWGEQGAALDKWRQARLDHGWTRTTLDTWKRVLFLGDVHGRLDEARALVEPFVNDRHTFLVFLGDMPSKGPQAAETVRWIGRTFQGPDRGLTLRGNHDLHLEDWAMGIEVLKKDFVEHWPGEGTPLSAQAAKSMLDSMVDAAVLTWKGWTIHATHGGLAQPPQTGRAWAAADAIFGTGEPTLDIDTVWDTHTTNAPHMIQVHGHRNAHLHPIRAAQRSWNVEGVESFGEVRALVLEHDGRTTTAAAGRCPFQDAPTWTTHRLG